MTGEAVAFPPGTPMICPPTATSTPTTAPSPLLTSDPSLNELNVQCVRPETDLISPTFCPRNLSAFGVPYSPLPSAGARICKPHDNDDELRVERAHFAVDGSTSPATLIIRVSISTPDDVSINYNFKVVFKGFKFEPSKYKTYIASFKFNGNPLNKLTTFQLEAQLEPGTTIIQLDEMSIKIKQSVDGRRGFARRSCVRFPAH
jgi:hypothetical protein